MGEVKRFDCASANDRANGRYALYTDHAEAMREKDAEIEQLSERCDTYHEAIGDVVSQLVKMQERAERAEAQRDALIACARMALDEPEGTHDWMPAFRRVLGLDTANKPL